MKQSALSTAPTINLSAVLRTLSRNLALILVLNLLLMSFLPKVFAVEFASPSIEEARLMLDISPKQAQRLSQDFLDNRRISGRIKQNASDGVNSSSTNPIRTPNNSIEALEILTQAWWQLGDKNKSQRYLEQAKEVAQRFSLPFKKLELDLLDARFQWLNSYNSERALERLSQLAAQLNNFDNSKTFTRRLHYQAAMIQAEVASHDGDMTLAHAYFVIAKEYTEDQLEKQRFINYHLAVGQHYLNNKRYNKALPDLLIAYWSAVDSNSSVQLAKANTLLAKVFYQRKVYDQALIYLRQAADFYNGYQDTPALAEILKLMGDSYYEQKRFNLALVHYLNVLDQDELSSHINQYIEMQIKLAGTYYQLENYELAKQYLDNSFLLLDKHNDTSLRARATLLQSGLAFYQGKLKQAATYGTRALSLVKTTKQIDLELETYVLLTDVNEQMGENEQALSFAKRYNELNQLNQVKLNQIGEDTFRQQKEFVEQTLHFTEQEKKLNSITQRTNTLQHVTVALTIAAVAFLIIIFRRGHIIRLQESEIDGINNRLFAHSRSNLSNLRMLNANLPSSLHKTSRTYEQWHIGELIHEPLSDRLRFAIIDVPFLRDMYLQYGYTAGLELEQSFGQFLTDKLNDDMRLFHFTDANLLYIEKNRDTNTPPHQLFEQIKMWIDEFQPSRDINRVIRMGIADYPFLPRAYMMINERELLDILLMATSTSCHLSDNEEASHWVYFKAIDNAPAASFASDNIRTACQQAIDQGIIKVHSSCKIEENIKHSLKM
ncbi:tetratricopeptide repeat protein [Vibrio sp. RC27]